jgi:hypothetical protein
MKNFYTWGILVGNFTRGLVISKLIILDNLKNSPNIRKVPPFPILRCNVHSRVLNGKARTNNSHESWHNAFSTGARVHPTFNRLIEAFRREQNNTDVLVSQIESGNNF